MPLVVLAGGMGHSLKQSRAVRGCGTRSCGMVLECTEREGLLRNTRNGKKLSQLRQTPCLRSCLDSIGDTIQYSLLLC